MAKASNNPKDRLTKAEKQALKLALRGFGFAQASLDSLIDENDPVLTPQIIGQRLAAYCRALPKGGN